MDFDSLISTLKSEKKSEVGESGNAMLAPQTEALAGTPLTRLAPRFARLTRSFVHSYTRFARFAHELI